MLPRRMRAALNSASIMVKAAGVAYTTILRRAESVNVGFGAGPVALASPVTIESGDKVLILVYVDSGITMSVTGITANSGAITFTSIGNSTPNTDTVHAFYADTAGVTSLTLSFTLSGATSELGAQIISIKGAAAGGPVASYFEFRAAGGTDPHDVDGGLAALAGGSLISFVFGNGVKTWTGATEYSGSEVAGAASGNTMAAAEQTTAGNITILGSGSGGPSFSNMVIADVSFAP